MAVEVPKDSATKEGSESPLPTYIQSFLGGSSKENMVGDGEKEGTKTNSSTPSSPKGVWDMLFVQNDNDDGSVVSCSQSIDDSTEESC